MIYIDRLTLASRKTAGLVGENKVWEARFVQLVTFVASSPFLGKLQHSESLVGRLVWQLRKLREDGIPRA